MSFLQILKCVIFCYFTLCFDLCFIYLECNDGGQTRIIIFKELNNFYIEKLFIIQKFLITLQNHKWV